MNCPECGGTKIGTRDSRKHPLYVRRRRWCKDCNTTFSTYEYAMNLQELKALQAITKVMQRQAKKKPVALKQVKTSNKPEMQFRRREAIQEANQTGETVQQVLDRWDKEALLLERRTA